MTDPAIQEVRRATRNHQKAQKDLEKARMRLKRSLLALRKKDILTDEEIARVWGRSRQALHKFIGPEKARVKTTQ